MERPNLRRSSGCLIVSSLASGSIRQSDLLRLDAPSFHSVSGMSNHSYLIGWSLQLNVMGGLRTESTIDLFEEEEGVVFCLHYEDAALLALLKQDVEAHLSYP